MNLVATSSGRRVLFALLYCTEGAPIGFLWWALPTLLRSHGVPIEAITALTSALVLPWALKFLWSPIIDVTRRRGWGLRGWIVTAQLIMGISLLPLLVIDGFHHLQLLTIVLLFHACAAATQDAAIDAFAILAVPPEERGRLNGWMQVGMLGGRSVLGGGALILAQIVGEQGLTLLLAGLLFTSAALVSLVRFPHAGAQRSRPDVEGWAFITARLRHTVSLRSTWMGLLFAGTAGAGYEAVGAVAGPFLVDKGVSAEEVGVFFALPAVAAMMVGALAGGYISDRMEKWTSVAVALGLTVLFVASLAAVGLMDSEPPRKWFMYLLTGLYFSIGFFTASSYAAFMEITDPALGATQFSAFMGATNACESWASFVVGRATARWGYPPAFLLMATVSLLSLALIRLLRRNDTRGAVDSLREKVYVSGEGGPYDKR